MHYNYGVSGSLTQLTVTPCAPSKILDRNNKEAENNFSSPLPNISYVGQPAKNKYVSMLYIYIQAVNNPTLQDQIIIF